MIDADRTEGFDDVMDFDVERGDLGGVFSDRVEIANAEGHHIVFVQNGDAVDLKIDDALVATFHGSEEPLAAEDVLDATSVDGTPLSLGLAGAAPIAVDDSFVTDEDTIVSLPSLTANDQGADGGPVRITGLDTTGLKGQVDGTDNGYGTLTQLTYSPLGPPTAPLQRLAEGESAIDTFDYTVTDAAGKTATASVRITVEDVNDAPDIDAGSDLSGGVTERPNGAADERSATLVTSGSLLFSDVGVEATDGTSEPGVPGVDIDYVSTENDLIFAASGATGGNGGDGGDGTTGAPGTFWFINALTPIYRDGPKGASGGDGGEGGDSTYQVYSDLGALIGASDTIVGGAGGDGGDGGDAGAAGDGGEHGVDPNAIATADGGAGGDAGDGGNGGSTSYHIDGGADVIYGGGDGDGGDGGDMSAPGRRLGLNVTDGDGGDGGAGGLGGSATYQISGGGGDDVIYGEDGGTAGDSGSARVLFIDDYSARAGDAFYRISGNSGDDHLIGGNAGGTREWKSSSEGILYGKASMILRTWRLRSI